MTITFRNPNDYWMKQQPPSDPGDTAKAMMLTVVFFIIMIVALLMVTGCTTTRYVPVEVHTTDTLKQTVTKRDSIWLHDSIRVTEKGDTVRIERWRTKYVEREIHDTLYQATHDTIPKPYPVTEYRDRPRSKTDWFFIITGIIALFGVFIFIIYGVKRFLP